MHAESMMNDGRSSFSTGGAMKVFPRFRGANARNPFKQAQNNKGHHCRRYYENNRALQPLAFQGGSRDERPQRESDISAHREKTHGGSLVLTGDQVGDPAAFGVKESDSDAGEHRGEENSPVTVQKTCRGKTGTNQEYAGSHQPGPENAISQIPEQRQKRRVRKTPRGG